MAADEFLALTIRAAFSEEVAALGGVVSNLVSESGLFLARSIMPWVEEVRAGDQVQGGIALRSVGQDVFVHPYVFRQVCKNGCIVANALETRHLDLEVFDSEEEIVEAVRDAIRACGTPASFSDVAERMRTAQEERADLALNLMPLLERLPVGHGAELFGQIMGRFVADRDQTRFGLLNAVTSIARDSRNPELRWRLEEFGGGMLVPAPRAPKFDGTAAKVLALV